MKDQDILLIDASIYIFRAYFSMPDHWHSDTGVGTGAVYGYCQFLLNILSRGQRPMACCYDESLNQCFRNAIYPDYKANRVLPDDDLAYQLTACQRFSQLLGIPSYASSVYEADDLIGSLMAWAKRHPHYAGQAIAIVTRDKDLGQLIVRDEDYLWNFADDEIWFRAQLLDRFGVQPEQFADYLALVGDSVDNIPGVPGIGPKTAAALLNHFPSITSIFENLPNIAQLTFRGAKTIAPKLEAHLEQIAVAKMLATIACDVPLPQGDGLLSLQSVEPEPLSDFCHEMGFPNVFSRIEQIVFEATSE